jgi:hypothetical protein
MRGAAATRLWISKNVVYQMVLQTDRSDIVPNLLSAD